jgi:ABC-type bacteriocin/lantibiotic exporter with double-glycine peptidase domain
MIAASHFTRPHHFFLLLTSSMITNALALALPMMTMQVYDRILSNRAEDTLMVLAAGVLIAALVELILRSCRSIVVGLNGANFEHEVNTLALKRILEADPRLLQSSMPATLAQDIGASARLKDYYGGQMMVTLLIDAPFILLFLGLEGYLAGWLALVPTLVLALFLAVSWRQGTRLRALMDQREAQDNARYSFVTEALRVVHSIKALCLEAPMVRRFEELQRDSGPVNYQIACTHGLTGSLSYGFGQLMTVAVICAGAPQAIDSHITVGTLIACVLLSGQVMQPLQRGLSMWIRFQDFALAKERLNQLLCLPRRHFISAEELGFNHGEVRLDKICFSYQGDHPVIDGASLAIMPGETVAITGPSGSGKTTLLEIMAGIYAPDRGRVVVSGMDVSAIPVAERARYIAYLPMRGMTLRGSIMDNLTGFNPQLRAQARAVADQLGIEEAVSLLPSGYDTPLEGHMTDVISPGLKQRISAARALLHKPRLILFDNADHGMDHESYVRIFEVMARLKNKATLVLVSDDRNILSLATRVVELRRGQLVAPISPTAPPVVSLFSNRERA